MLAIDLLLTAYTSLYRRAESSDLGQLYSFDSRISAAVNARTGGLLQATTYVAGRTFSIRSAKNL